jgi:glyoxylase-like metal-dependent hydrolase (beta-lactamase superfamily II)
VNIGDGSDVLGVRAASGTWRQVGEGVFVRRHESYDLNVGLVVGDGACLVIDTRASHAEARDLVGAIRRITAHPWVVVNTHAHFDHYFGNAVFLPASIWGHERCAEVIALHGEEHRRQLIAEGGPVAELREVDIRAPDRVFATSATLDVGGRPVALAHLGRGHTDNDIVVSVPDAGVVFAGDLVEQGAPPAFEDSFPLDWPSTTGRLLAQVTGVVVPGHGDVVSGAFVEGQRQELATLAELVRCAFAEGRRPGDVGAGSPFPAEVTRVAVDRAYRQLRGG